MFGLKKKQKKMITKDMTLGEVLSINKKVGPVLLGFGMHCLGCPHSQMETLEEAAAVHGIDLNLLISKLQEVVK